MNKQLANLAVRRLEIIKIIETQRMEMTDTCGHMHNSLVVVDGGLKVGRFIYRHPVLVAGGLTALLMWRRKRIAGVAESRWHLLYRYSSAILFGLKLFQSAAHFFAENRNTEILQDTSPD